MSVTLTLKNIPDPVYQRLKQAAELHRRSLNSEAIVCLEAVLMPGRITAAEHLAHARRLRSGLAPQGFEPAQIDAMKKRGRP